LEAWDLGEGEGCVGLIDAVWQVYGAAGVFEDDGLEAKGLAVDGGVADAEVVGEAAEEETVEAAFAQVSGEAGGGEVVVFEEGGVGVDGAAEAFAEDEFGVGDIEGGVKGCAFGVLEGVFGPEGLGAVGGFGRLVGVFVGVGGGEGDVLGRVPVLGEDDVGESLGESVDERNDGVATCNGQGAAGHEVVLEVDDQEGVGGLEGNGHGGVIGHPRNCLQCKCGRPSDDAHLSESRYGVPGVHEPREGRRSETFEVTEREEAALLLEASTYSSPDKAR
jgi:hypothetical protein